MQISGITEAVQALKQGGIIAYPTESCYGLGCDPMNEEAVNGIIRLKGRPFTHGVLLVAANTAQIEPYLSPAAEQYMEAPRRSWPGPFTWLLPASAETGDWITGGSDAVAIRISANQVVQQLCNEYGGAVVSTSANPHGQPPAANYEETLEYFAGSLSAIVNGPTDGHDRPSQIQDARTGKILRSA